ncbi:TPA: hypothetical protein HA280_06320 [Candidatus Woesearchaeota archaeon]|nr:hypothetical protein [Candidatus Woesearchaeota archaeon]
MVTLPENTLIGNPLYIPYQNTDGKYGLTFYSMDAGLWVATPPHTLEETISLSTFRRHELSEYAAFCGSLFEIAYFFRMTLPNPLSPNRKHTLCWQYNNPSSLDDLLSKGFLKQTNYVDFFKQQNFHELDTELKNIPDFQQTVYYVTLAGHDKVGVGLKHGKNPRILSDAETQGPLAPIPVRT